jgi:hypothetical protein
MTGSPGRPFDDLAVETQRGLVDRADLRIDVSNEDRQVRAGEQREEYASG